MKRGIAIAGNILADTIKLIPSYPEMGMLVNITQVKSGVGGCVPNTAMSLAAIDGKLPVSVFGKIGSDEAGRFVISRMKDAGIGTSGVSVSDTSPTSFTDVMTVIGSGERTFFHTRGANREFCPEDIDLEALDCDILHIGYLLLLDRFDEADAEYGTKMARFLKEVRSRGIKTSVDAVSETGGRFSAVVPPALRYADYAVLNEIEAGAAAGIPPRDGNGRLMEENIRTILERFLEMGVKECAAIHCPEAGFCMDGTGRLTRVSSLKLPEGYIKGTVGAGDAFCAGFLYAAHEGYPAAEALRFASGAAAACLSSEDSVGGAASREGIEKLIELYGRGIR